MNVILNGEQIEIASEIGLAELLTQMSLPKQRIAVELNKQVVRRKDWDATKLSDADKIEVVHFVGGG